MILMPKVQPFSILFFPYLNNSNLLIINAQRFSNITKILFSKMPNFKNFVRQIKQIVAFKTIIMTSTYELPILNYQFYFQV